VAYELDAYRPIFGNLLHYVRPFDRQVFQQTARDVLNSSRAGRIQTDSIELEAFKQEHCWKATQKRFLNALNSFGG